MASRNSLNVVLLGKTGAGKSAAGNTILERNAFQSESSLNSVTERSSIKDTQIGERMVSVVDTPGFFETTLSDEALAEELARSVYLSIPGTHAFLYVVPVDQRFTQQEFDTAQQLLKVFGEHVSRYTIVLFTHGDNSPVNLGDQIIGNKYLSSLIQQCGRRYHVFNNYEIENREQVTQLLEKIDRMVTQNGGGCYTSELYRRANSSKWEVFWEDLKEFFLAAIKAICAVYKQYQAVRGGSALRAVSL